MVGLTGEGARGGGWGLTATPAAAAAGWMEGRDGGMAAGTAPGRAGRRRAGARLRQLPAIQSCTLNHTLLNKCT